MSQKQKTRQASEIWRMLDNLSKTDPIAYKKFIKEQMDLGKTITSPPEPQMLIRANTHKSKFSFVYLLLCSWSRIPKNNDKNEPINVIGGDSFEAKDNLGNDKTIVYPLAFSDDTIKEMLDYTNERKQLEIIDTSIEYVKMQNKVDIDTNAMYEICSEKSIGLLDDLYSSFKYKEFDPESEFKECFGDINAKPDILQEISQLKNQDDSEEEIKQLNLPSNQNKSKSKILIQELNEPIINWDKKSNRLNIEIVIPSVKSIKDLELDISQKKLHLEIPSDKTFKTLTLDFPCSISIDCCNAKYHKKLSKLSISALVE